jgi:hypothetical protein
MDLKINMFSATASSSQSRTGCRWEHVHQQDHRAAQSQDAAQELHHVRPACHSNLFGSTLQLRSSSNNDFDGCQSWIGQHHLWQEVLALLNSDMACCEKILGYDLQDKNQRIHGRMCAYGQQARTCTIKTSQDDVRSTQAD